MVKEKMDKTKCIGTDDAAQSGVKIVYVARKKMIYLYGWHDGFVGIEPIAYTLDEFCKQLGIKEE